MCKLNVYKKDVPRKNIRKSHFDETPEDTAAAALGKMGGNLSLSKTTTLP